VECSIIQRDGNPIGIVVVRRNHPRPGSAIIEFVGTMPEHARAGLGMQAAMRIESDLHRSGIVEVYVPSPAVHGISMYFWVRLGYAPIMREEWPCALGGVAWLRRSLA
jgi:hypothetical protein